MEIQNVKMKTVTRLKPPTDVQTTMDLLEGRDGDSEDNLFLIYEVTHHKSN